MIGRCGCFVVFVEFRCLFVDFGVKGSSHGWGDFCFVLLLFCSIFFGIYLRCPVVSVMIP